MAPNWTALLAQNKNGPTSPQNDYIARMLLEQGTDSSPIQNPLQGLARLAQSYVGKSRMDADMARGQAGNQALADLLAPPTDTVANGPQQTAPLQPPPAPPPPPPMPAPSAGPGQASVQAPNIAPTGNSLDYSTPQISTTVDPKNAQIAQILQGGIGQNAFAQQALKQLGIGSQTEFDATPRTDQNGNQYIVGKDGTFKFLTGIKARDEVGVSGTNVYNKYSGDPLGKLPDTQSPERVAQEEKIRAAGRPQMNVSVNADKSFGTQLGGNAAQILDASHTAAQGGLQAIRTAHQIKGALDSGKVSAGPGATAIQFFNQISGGDPDKIVATRQTIQGLAQLALAARSSLKGQGQISDYEGRLLQAASAGKIDEMTVPEIRSITDVAERAARISIKQNATNVAKARTAAPKNQELVDFYNVDEPPEYVAPPKAVKGDPQTDALLKKYGIP